MFTYARLVLAAAVVSIAANAIAQTEPATMTPSATQEGVQQLVVVVAEVVGMAQVRLAPDQQWQMAAVGMELPQGAEVRTGTKSRVVCRISDDQTLTLNRLGTISILEAIRADGKDTTDLIMKYGRTDYAIEKAGKEHDATIRTPNSTLSVRGTDFTAYDQPPFTPQMETRSGVVDFRSQRRLMRVGAGGKAKGRSGAAEVALQETVVDPSIARARTDGEALVIANEISRGAVLGFDPFTQIATTSGGLGPQTDEELIGSLPGRLNFVLRWNTPGSDFNLAVLHLGGDPLEILGAFSPSEVLYPGFGLDKTVSGGRIAVDNRGGPNGGQEIGFYPQVNPGIYGLQALHAGGPGGTVSFSAFIDGKPTTLFATLLDEEGNPVPNDNGLGFKTEFANTITRPVGEGGLETANALIPFPDFLLPASDAQSVAGSSKKSKQPAVSLPVTGKANKKSPTKAQTAKRERIGMGPELPANRSDAAPKGRIGDRAGSKGRKN